jgi:hypothetical protein
MRVSPEVKGHGIKEPQLIRRTGIILTQQHQESVASADGQEKLQGLGDFVFLRDMKWRRFRSMMLRGSRVLLAYGRASGKQALNQAGLMR